MRDFYRFWNFWLTIGALVPTAIMLSMVFITDELAIHVLHLDSNGLRLANAGMSLFSFVCILVQLVWKPDSLEAAHARAARLYIDGEPTRDLPPIPSAKVEYFARAHHRRTQIMRGLAVGAGVDA